MQPMEMDADAPLLTINSGNTESVAAAPNSEMSKCPVLNGAGIAGVTATATVVGAIATPAPTTTTTTVVKGDASMTSLLSHAKKSNARNSIHKDEYTHSHDVSIIEDDLFDLDSEITNVEENEDNLLNADELQKKLDKIVRASLNCKEALEKTTNQLRDASFGQELFWRRYWKLPKADGIFIEALESAENNIFGYQETLESMDDEKHAKLNNEQKMDDRDVPDEEPQSANPTAGAEGAAAATEPMEVMMPSLWKPPISSHRIIRRSIQSRMRKTTKGGLARSCQKMCMLPVKESVVGSSSKDI
ncbi:GH11762 [Drosophila grimshawi]|uniref:GH11762 n=1 Tax=Drosophila grimshawi TaxID=7222 RepID=B4K095_DROGR|nr:GH11762 [Drosophila grimshawi]